MIIFGTRRFGWVDRVDGLGIVATLFFHIMFIPLIPLETALMVDSHRGYKLPMSIKSVAVAWVRSALFWSTLALVVLVPATFGISLCAGIPTGIGYVVLPLIARRASEARAAELRTALGRR